MNNPYQFSFGRELKADPSYFKKHFRQKFKDIEATLGSRDRPNILWMNEFADDTKLRLQDYSLNNGIPTLAATLNDFESGLAIIGGQPNAGKSTAVISMIAGALDLNPELIIVDFSFDDDAKKRQVQLMANLSGLHYSQLYTKSDLSEKEEAAKILAAKKIMGWIEDGKYWPFEASEMFNLKNKNITTTLRTVGVLKDTMGVLREQYPDKKIAFFVDAWNDLDLSEESEYIGRVDNVISDLKDRANSEQIMTFFTAHIRKTEGKSYRVRLEDIKGTKAFEYAVKWGCIVRNEHRENALQNPLRLEKNGRIHPVLIMETQKQKSSDWDMPLLYPMEPSKCRLMAPTVDEYEELLMQYQSVRK